MLEFLSVTHTHTYIYIEREREREKVFINNCYTILTIFINYIFKIRFNFLAFECSYCGSHNNEEAYITHIGTEEMKDKQYFVVVDSCTIS